MTHTCTFYSLYHSTGVQGEANPNFKVFSSQLCLILLGCAIHSMYAVVPAARFPSRRDNFPSLSHNGWALGFPSTLKAFHVIFMFCCRVEWLLFKGMFWHRVQSSLIRGHDEQVMMRNIQMKVQVKQLVHLQSQYNVWPWDMGNPCAMPPQYISHTSHTLSHRYIIRFSRIESICLNQRFRICLPITNQIV